MKHEVKYFPFGPFSLHETLITTILPVKCDTAESFHCKSTNVKKIKNNSFLLITLEEERLTKESGQREVNKEANEQKLISVSRDLAFLLTGDLISYLQYQNKLIWLLLCYKKSAKFRSKIANVDQSGQDLMS